MRKPDNVADNPGLLPYGSNIGAPSIKIDNVDGWKKSNVFKVNKELRMRFYEKNYLQHKLQFMSLLKLVLQMMAISSKQLMLLQYVNLISM